MRGERALAYTAVAGFAALVLAAALLWMREGSLVYLARIVGDLQNCL